MSTSLSSAAAHVDPATMAPVARLAEIARLLAVGALRALWANTARCVAMAADRAPSAPRGPAENPLAALAPAEPACGNTRARVPPAGRVPHQATGDDR
jgi:hypothetical protein